MKTFAAVSLAAVCITAIAYGPAFGQTAPASALTDRQANPTADKRGTHGNRARLLSEYKREKAAEKQKAADAQGNHIKKLERNGSVGIAASREELLKAKSLKRVGTGYAAGMGAMGRNEKWRTELNGKPGLGNGRFPYGSGKMKSGAGAFWERAKDRLAKSGRIPGVLGRHPGAAGPKGASKSASGILGYSNGYGMSDSKKEDGSLSYTGGIGMYSGKAGYASSLTSGSGYFSGIEQDSRAKRLKKMKNRTQDDEADKSAKSTNKDKKKSEDKDKTGTKEDSPKP